MKLHAAVLCCGLFAVATPAISQPPPSKSDQALADAIKTLENAKSTINEPKEKLKLEQAIAAISDLRRTELNAAIIGFADDPEKYTGKTLILMGRVTRVSKVGSPSSIYGTCHDWEIEVQHFGKSISKSITVSVPSRMKTPGLPTEGEVVFSFICTKGSMAKGNYANYVRR